MDDENSSNPIESIFVVCEDPELIFRAVNAVFPKLPRHLRLTFDRLTIALFHQYGKAGLFERINNKSVASIFAEYGENFDNRPLAEGERGGVKYKLFESPDAADS